MHFVVVKLKAFLCPHERNTANLNIQSVYKLIAAGQCCKSVSILNTETKQGSQTKIATLTIAQLSEDCHKKVKNIKWPSNRYLRLLGSSRAQQKPPFFIYLCQSEVSEFKQLSFCETLNQLTTCISQSSTVRSIAIVLSQTSTYQNGSTNLYAYVATGTTPRAKQDWWFGQ